MNVILTQDIPQLGSLGDEVRVKDGYARNFLIPKGKAILSSTANARQLAHRRRLLDNQRKGAISQATSVADKVANLTLTLEAKIGEKGRLFGSITNRDVQEALAKEGIQLDRHNIQLTAPIKNVGAHTAILKLHSQVKTELALKVVGVRDAQAVAAEAVEAAAAAAAAEAKEASQAEEAQAGAAE